MAGKEVVNRYVNHAHLSGREGEMTVREELYLSPRFPTREDLEKALQELQAPDATRTQWIANCPRRAEYGVVRGLVSKKEFWPLRAGASLHNALATYYVSYDPELALAELRASWGDPEDRSPSGENYSHLHYGHIEVVFKNYMVEAKKRDTFRPIIVHRDDLDLTSVVGAIWRVVEDERIVLGESKVIMEFIVNGKPFLYAGIPDLPIEMGGAYYILDHKSTNSYLSDYWFEQFRFSNQFRGYCIMIERLTGLTISGALVNGIYVGKRAILSDFKGNKFARFGPIMYDPGHYTEAILNQYYWRKMLDVYKQMGYYPQHASKLCAGCPFSGLCASNPAIREAVIADDYKINPTRFLEI